MKPEELFRYEEMYACMREAFGTSRLVFEIGPDALSGGLAPVESPSPEHSPTEDCPREALEP